VVVTLAVVFITAITFAAASVLLRGQPSASDERRAIYRACQTFVTSQLDTRTSADFPETADVVPLPLPFAANQWRVRGTFVERPGTNPPMPRTFVCDVSTDGDVVQVLGLTIHD
jgi:hypothetical protein